MAEISNYECRKIFITGGSGYLGQALIPMLLERGHTVTALIRAGSEAKVSGARKVIGNPLDASCLAEAVAGNDTWIQLIGTPHPAPWKTEAFRNVDLKAVTAMAQALPGSSIRHAIYLSVAQPTPTMRAYQRVREQGEALLKATGLPTTFLRPFYVLGPGHSWPYALLPVYALMEKIPFTREGALRLGLVTLGEMVAALTLAVENVPSEIRILGAPEIRAAKIPRRV